MQNTMGMSEKDTTAPATPFPELFVDDDIEVSRLKKGPANIAEPPFVTVARDYPRVANAIEMTWGHRELDSYLQRLIVADRGDRAGFPKPVLAALLNIYQQHAAQFNFPHSADTWSQSESSKDVTSMGFPRAENVWDDDPMAKHTHREGKKNFRRN